MLLPARHAPDGDRVVPGLERLGELAVDPGHAAVKERPRTTRAARKPPANVDAPHGQLGAELPRPALRMFTQNAPAARIFGQLVDDLSGRKATSGGSRDTDVNELHHHADRPGRPDRGNHCRARGEVPENVPEPARIKRGFSSGPRALATRRPGRPQAGSDRGPDWLVPPPKAGSPFDMDVRQGVEHVIEGEPGESSLASASPT